MSEPREQEDLEAMIASAGWTLFIAQMKAEWSGAAYDQKLQEALNVTEDALAAGRARQVQVTRRELNKLLLWPQERIADLARRVAPAPTLSRRGGL